MGWVDKLNESVNYIEENLAGDISYGAISRIVGCSVYNFQRMFSYITDKPLSEYIRNRRLTMAASDLLDNSDRIIDISLKCGYESQDAFTRAFKNFHGILPSRVRGETVQLRSYPKLSFRIKIKGEGHMSYQIEQWPAFKVVGISQEVKTEEAFEVVPDIWENAWRDGIVKRFLDSFPGYGPSGFLGIARGGRWGGSEYMEYIITVTSHVDASSCECVPILEGMKEFSYPTGTWVTFETSGELSNAIQEVYKQFYTEWLPSSGYELANLPIIGCYIQENQQKV